MFSHVQLFRVEASRVKLRTVYWIDRINYYKYGSRVQRGLNLSSIIYARCTIQDKLLLSVLLSLSGKYNLIIVIIKVIINSTGLIKVAEWIK